MQWIVLWVIGFGCASPQQTTRHFMGSLQKGNFDAAAKLTRSGDLKLHPVRRMVIEDAMVLLLQKMKYQIVAVQHFGNRATVVTKVRRIPFSKAFALSAREVMEKGLFGLSNPATKLNYQQQLMQDLEAKITASLLDVQSSDINVQLERVDSRWVVVGQKKLVRDMFYQ